MSLLSLLPFSRAFTPDDRRNGRYQPADKGVLPDFSSPRATGTPPASKPERVFRPGGEAWVAPSASPIPVAPLSERTSGASSERPSPGSRPTPQRLPVWLEQLILGLLRPGNRRRGSRTVQTELSFRAVTPARNDLTTSDLEVVPARRPGGPGGLSPACRQRLLKLWWQQGARRIQRWGGLWS